MVGQLAAARRTDVAGGASARSRGRQGEHGVNGQA